jgi:hypothetical protein
VKEHELGPNEFAKTDGLDDTTADRLLDGSLGADDAPQGYQAVARTLQAAAMTAQEPVAGAPEAAVAAFHAARPQPKVARTSKWRVALATLAGGLTLSTGLAAADVLPGAAQDVASEALAKVGINVPGNHDDHANSRGKSAEHKNTATDEDDDATTDASHPDNHGSVVSNVAHDDSTEGVDHGAAVCATASEDKCKAGEQGGPGAGGPSANSTEGSANAGQPSANSTEGETNSGQGSTNGGQSSGNSSSSTGTQTGGSGSGSGTSTNVSSGTGG